MQKKLAKEELEKMSNEDLIEHIQTIEQESEMYHRWWYETSQERKALAQVCVSELPEDVKKILAQKFC